VPDSPRTDDAESRQPGSRAIRRQELDRRGLVPLAVLPARLARAVPPAGAVPTKTRERWANCVEVKVPSGPEDEAVVRYFVERS